MPRHFRLYRVVPMGFFPVWRQVFWQKRPVVRQQIVSATCNPVWQTITPGRRWSKPPCHISCRACKPCSAPRCLADFLVLGDTLCGKNVQLGCACTAAWRQQYAAYADTTHYAAEHFLAFSLLSKTLRHFGDSNSVGETTLILTINTIRFLPGNFLLQELNFHGRLAQLFPKAGAPP
jgi:hypothetical protein